MPQESNTFNAVNDVEELLAYLRFEYNEELLRANAVVCHVALLSAASSLLQNSNPDAIRIGTEILAVGTLLDCASKVSDASLDSNRRIVTLRVCRASLSHIRRQMSELIVQFQSNRAARLLGIRKAAEAAQ